MTITRTNKINALGTIKMTSGLNASRFELYSMGTPVQARKSEQSRVFQTVDGVSYSTIAEYRRALARKAHRDTILSR